MALYCGIDLHARNAVIAVLDEADRVVVERRVPTDLARVLAVLGPYRAALAGVVVESTFNWYWMVDGLQAAGYAVRLAHTPAIAQYTGLKYTDDQHDARWLAHLLRLGLVPTGYIYPKAEWAVRDLLRQRSHLVRQRTTHVLRVQTLVARETGMTPRGHWVKPLAPGAAAWPAETPWAHGVGAHLAVVQTLEAQIAALERAVLAEVKPRAAYAALRTIPGVGAVLAQTILLECGDVRRFATPGQFASYCRCVAAPRLSNGKVKGANTAKNGNRYLAWAFVEAAHVAVRYHARVRRFYERKRATRNPAVAIKAVAHTLARAAFSVLRDGVPFDMDKAFA